MSAMINFSILYEKSESCELVDYCEVAYAGMFCVNSDWKQYHDVARANQRCHY